MTASNAFDRPPPHDNKAEEAVLGAMLLEPRAAVLAIELLTAEEFYAPSSQLLFRVLIELYAKQVDLDEVIVGAELERRGLTERIGGPSALGRLIEATPSAANIEKYCRIVREKAQARSALMVAAGLASGSLSPADGASQLAEITNFANGQWPLILDGADILSNPPPNPSQLIEGLLYRGGKLNINGPSKARKTFFQMHLAVCIATGTKWLDFCVVKGRVLYINLELLPWSFFDRLAKITQALNVSLEPRQLSALHLRGFRPSVESLEKYLSAAVKNQNYSIIFFDPLYKILGLRDENAAGDMGDLMNRLESIGRSAGSSVAFAHHFAKGSAAAKETLDRGAGSGVLARDGDSIITLTPHEEEDCLSMEPILRDFPESPPITLRWRFPLFEKDASIDPSKLKQPNQQKISPVFPDQVLAAASSTPQNRADLINAVMAFTDRGYKPCRAAVAETIGRGLLAVSKNQRPNVRPELLYSKL